MTSLKEMLSSFEIVGSRIILDPKSITAIDARHQEDLKTSDLLDFPMLSLSALTALRDANADVTADYDVIYKRRWYVLCMFSLLAFLHTAVGTQWKPVSAITGHIYGWTEGTITLLENWRPIVFLPTALLWAWLVDAKGIGGLVLWKRRRVGLS